MLEINFFLHGRRHLMPPCLRRRPMVSLLTSPPSHSRAVLLADLKRYLRWVLRIQRSSAAMVTSGLPERLLSTTDPVVTSLYCKREKVLRLTLKCLAIAAAVIHRSIPTASCLSCKLNIRHLAFKKWTLDKANHAASCNTSSDEMRKRQA